jgi:hypothetical protein
MKTIEIDLSMKMIQNLNEPAHMGPFEPVRQINIHIDRCHSMLPFFCLIEDCYRITDRFNTDFFNINATMIKLTLNIFHGLKSEIGPVIRSPEQQENEDPLDMGMIEVEEIKLLPNLLGSTKKILI